MEEFEADISYKILAAIPSATELCISDQEKNRGCKVMQENCRYAIAIMR